MKVIKSHTRTYLLIAACIAAATPLSTRPGFVTNRYLLGLGAATTACLMGAELYATYGTKAWQTRLVDISCGLLLGAVLNDTFQEQVYDNSIEAELKRIAAAGSCIETAAYLPKCLKYDRVAFRQNRIRTGGAAILGGMFAHELMQDPNDTEKKKTSSSQMQRGGILLAGTMFLRTLLSDPTDDHDDDDSDKPGRKKPKGPFTFKNLAGTIPQDVQEIADFIKNKKRYDAVGATMPKGILLVGPPGTGKTSIARAIAGETDASFFSTNGSQFLSKWIGEGEREIRKLFEKARASVKSGKHKKAIIFIDEIDAIGVERGKDRVSKGYNGKLSELLSQLDGFNQDESIFIIGATNRLKDLDPALTRSGRFDRIVTIGLPDEKSRKEILTLWLEPVKSQNINVSLLAQKTKGLNCADLKNLVNEAAIYSVRDNSNIVMQKHFELVLKTNERYKPGKKKKP